MRAIHNISVWLIGSVLLVSPIVSARVVTLTQQATGGNSGVAELVIEPFEVAEVISFPTSMNANSTLEVLKDGRRAVHQVGANPDFVYRNLIVAGPATIRLIVASASSAGLCTIRVTPEAYPPDKSILVPPGTGGAAITLECSTNLVNWTATTNGVYTNLPAAKFFRIREERIQGN